MQVGISQVSSGCYYVVRNQLNPPGSKTCTDICNSYMANIMQSPNNGNGSPGSLGAIFFQCYQCTSWLCSFGSSSGSYPVNANGITVSLDGVNIDPAILAVTSIMISDCDGIFSWRLPSIIAI